MALVAPSGNVEWLCLPRVDSPSVFGALLDRHAGGFRLGPADVIVPADRRYLPGTMVLETSWGTATGWIIVRDVLLVGPWHHEDELSHTHRRAPTDYDADHVLVRPPLAALAGPGSLPRPSLALVPGAERPHPEGPDLRPDRRGRGRRHHVTSRDPRRRAQLGLPLHVDSRLGVHALGHAHARVRL